MPVTGARTESRSTSPDGIAAPERSRNPTFDGPQIQRRQMGSDRRPWPGTPEQLFAIQGPLAQNWASSLQAAARPVSVGAPFCFSQLAVK